MAFQIQFILSALLLSTVQASRLDKGPQTFDAPQPQNAQRHEEVIVYLTPSQIRNYEAGRGLPNLTQASLSYEQQSPSQAAPSFAYEQDRKQQAVPSYVYEQEKTSQAAPTFIFEQQKPEPETPIKEEEGRNIQSTLDILGGIKIRSQQSQQNNPNIEITKAKEDQNSGIRPIEEPNTENEEQAKFQLSLKPQQQQQEQNKLIEQANKKQEQGAKSYTYIHFFSNQKPENPQKIQTFHPEPHTVNLEDEIRLQKEKNIEFQRDPLLRQKYKFIPYEYIAEQNIHQKVRDDLIKQGEKQVQQQLSVPAPEQIESIKERQNQQKEYQQLYTPQFNNTSNNTDLGKIIREIQLLREAENISKSPPVVIQRDPVHVIKQVNIPYPARFFVPVSKQEEVEVPQPYAVPIEIIRRVPIAKTESVEVEKPVPSQAEIVEKKVYVPVEKPYSVGRIVPVEVKKDIAVENPYHKPNQYTILRHTWKH